MAYAKAMKKQLTNKEKKKRLMKQNQISETKKNDKLQQLENLCKLLIAKILNGKKNHRSEVEIKN